MFNNLTVGFFTLFSYGVMIVGAALALYVVVMAFRQAFGGKRDRAPRQNVVFAASEPSKKAPESRDTGNRR
jgi:hypothetical protein